MAEKKHNGKRRIPTWKEIAKEAKFYGFTQLLTPNKIVLERGRQRTEIKRIQKQKRWKVEHYSGKIMDDTSGIENERDAKVDTVGMAVLK